MRTKVDLTSLLQACRTLTYTVDGSGVLMAYMPSAGVPVNLPGPLFDAVKEITSYRKANALGIMVNIIPPGITVPKHRDFLNPVHGKKHPCIERFHLPILTNPESSWWDETKTDRFHIPLGCWAGPVRYWKLHDVCNLGTTDRIHLIVDLDRIVEGASYSN